MTQSKMDIDMQMHSLFLIAFDGNHLVDTHRNLSVYELKFVNNTNNSYTHRCMFYYDDKLEFKRLRRQRHSLISDDDNHFPSKREKNAVEIHKIEEKW